VTSQIFLGVSLDIPCSGKLESSSRIRKITIKALRPNAVSGVICTVNQEGYHQMRKNPGERHISSVYTYCIEVV
jgi:hypothetical protein